MRRSTALNVDDAVASAEGLMCPADFIEGGGYLFVVLWMFVRQHQSGGGPHGARFIAVHSLDFG
jgi:hypothetical protein